MIIWGTTGITSTREKGEFYCPSCSARSPYHRKSVRRFFTLYFIPIIPLNRVGEFIRCTKCRKDFNDTVLEHDPEAQARAFDALLKMALLRVLADLTAADGVVTGEEIVLMRLVFEETTGIPLDELDARQFAEEAPQQVEGLEALLAGLGPNLNDAGREMIVKAALRIAAADGEIAPEETERIERIASALGISRAHLKGIEAEVMA